MPIINLMTYEPEIKEIKKEHQIVRLLADVRRAIRDIDPDSDFAGESLRPVLKTVEKGSYDFSSGVNGVVFNHRVDLSAARALVDHYKFLSSKGCQSCQHKASYQPLQGETSRYCGLYEKPEEDVDLRYGLSPRVQKYDEKGCEDRKAIFKPLEAILKSTSPADF